ncbi:MAG: glycosyltransferase family 39 protein [Magnetococcales bacterium]|nr:glycosyltransferase family 39 protein [Magnetococcales bacterium]
MSIGTWWRAHGWSGGVMLAVIGVAAASHAGWRTLDPGETREWLIRWSGTFLGINLCVILAAGILEWERIRNLARRLFPGRLLYLPLVFLVGGTLYTALLAPQTHRIFYDETLYLSIGQNLAQLDRAQICHAGGETYGQFRCDQGEYNKQPNGYPFLISLLFRLVGTSEQAAFYFNNLLLGTGAVIALLLVFPAGGSWRAGLFAAGVMTLDPQNLHWYNTTAAEPASAVMTALTLLAAFHYRRAPTRTALALLAALSAFAVQFRPESLLLLPLVLVLAWRPASREPGVLLAMLLLFLVLTLPLWLHLELFHNHPWGSAGKPFSLEYLGHNLAVNGWHYFDNQRFPLPFTLLAVIGLLRPGGQRFERGVTGLWFLLFWGVFLFFYAGSYRYGADVRYALLSAVPLAVLAGLGAETLFRRLSHHLGASAVTGTGLVAALLWGAHLPFMPLVRATTDEAWAARADLRFARQMVAHLPPESLVLSHNPSLFQLWGAHGAQLSLLRSDPVFVRQVLMPRYRGGLYFHHNFWCNVPDKLQNDFCDHARAEFHIETVVEYREQKDRYGLYRLRPKSTVSAP